MRAAGVPTAETMPVAQAPCVIKADGLAAGKGVFVCRTQEELDDGAARRDSSRPAARRRGAARGPRGLDLRAVRRRARHPAAARAGLQARVRRRRGTEHGRHGLVRACARRRRARARRRGSPAGARGARAPRLAVRRRSLRRADAHRERAAACSSSTAASAIPRRSRSCRSSTTRCSTRSRRAPPATLDGVDAACVGRCGGDGRDRGRVVSRRG